MAQKGEIKDGNEMLDQLIKGLIQCRNKGSVCESIEISNESRDACPPDPEFDDLCRVIIPTGRSH